jgi:Flp pilus assembly protein TadG
MKRLKARFADRGSAMVETAIVLPILLLIAVGIFDIGRAYQTWAVVTNAAREGARVSILPNSTVGGVTGVVRNYMSDGALPNAATAGVIVDQAASLTVNGASVSASQVTVNYPFSFLMLQYIAQLVTPSSSFSSVMTMQATSVMRNEQ